MNDALTVPELLRTWKYELRFTSSFSKTLTKLCLCFGFQTLGKHGTEDCTAEYVFSPAKPARHLLVRLSSCNDIKCAIAKSLNKKVESR